jgi:transposase
MGLAWPGFSTAKGSSCSRSTGQTVPPRRRRGKSDPVDAEAAARAVLAGQATAIPKTGSHLVEMIRCLRVTRATAVKARTQAANALRALVVTAPAELREQLRGLPTGRLASTAARLRPGPILTVTAATKLALRVLGQRYQTLEAELAAVDAELDLLTAQAAPRLRRLCGVGPEIAGALLVAAGDNPERLRSEAAFSMLVRRTKEGLSKREIIRCLKRYVAREIFTAMNAPAAPPDAG